MLDQILSLHVEYTNEIMAEGAWCGHAYATEYFADLRNRMINVAKQLKESRNRDIVTIAEHILFILATDYDKLVTKTYENESFDEWDKRQIAEALSNTFIDRVEEAFKEFSVIYEKLSGKAYEAAIEAAMGST